MVGKLATRELVASRVDGDSALDMRQHLAIALPTGSSRLWYRRNPSPSSIFDKVFPEQYRTLVAIPTMLTGPL